MTKETKILYNAECPVCSFEIKHHSRYAAKHGLPVQFDDLNSDALAEWEVSADAAARTLHVIHEGQLYQGLEANRVMWRTIPHMRWAAWLTGLPIVRQIANFTYDRLFAPLIYRLHLRRLRRKRQN